MDNNKGGWKRGREGGLGWWGGLGEKGRKLLEQQLKNLKI